ncbi:MAG: hypothetical protein K2O06_18660, partial [Acetatifactor sp.]|nr:hypothetical protein [Acetatifactor sp.]
KVAILYTILIIRISGFFAKIQVTSKTAGKEARRKSFLLAGRGAWCRMRYGHLPDACKKEENGRD